MTRQPTTTPALADHAAEAVRALCHRTIGDTLNIADTYAVVGGLAALSHRLSQLTNQLSLGLQRRHTGPGYQLDHDGQARWANPTGAVTAAVDALATAGRLAEELGHQLDTAHNVTSHLIDGRPRHEPNQPEGQQ